MGLDIRKNYGWIIVVICAVLFFNHGTILYSYGVFFKPLAAAFNWSRAETSLAYSLEFGIMGIFQIFAGWFIDRFGPRKTILAGGLIVGASLFASSFISQLWHLYLIYGLLLSLGMSGVNLVCNLTTIRWFGKNRGMALGIVSAGLGVGTSVGVPVVSSLISSPLGWRGTYMCLAVFALVVMLTAAAFLRNPKYIELKPEVKLPVPENCFPVILKSKTPLLLIMTVYFLFLFAVQIMMVHLVNYATDLGYSRLTGASLLSVVGVLSIIGRLSMGFASDRIGNITSIIICCGVVAAAFLLAIIVPSQIGLYFIAVLFGFGYGGEIPQIAPITGSFYGYKSTGSLIGSVYCAGCIGGAFGAWAAGYIYDISQSYVFAFGVAAFFGIVAVCLAVLLKKQRRKNSESPV